MSEAATPGAGWPLRWRLPTGRAGFALLVALYVALRDSAPKLSPAAAEAFGKAREVLARYGA